MNRFPSLLLTGLLLLSLFSCRVRENDNNSGEAEALYEASCKILEKYTDSIAAASDSASVGRLTAECEDKLARLNFEFPANTDLRLSEGQNDTLATLTDKFVETRKNRIKEIKRRRTEIPDSLKNVPQDSISTNKQ